MAPAGKLALIILCIRLALGLAFGVAVLTCGLACDDQAALAILVASGGTFLIVWGLIKVIRSISRKRKESGA